MRDMTAQDLMILSALRSNSRGSLHSLSKKINIPHSTLHDKVKGYEKEIIRKYTSVLNYEQLGYGCRAIIALKLSKLQTEKLHNYVLGKKEINNAYEINHGYDLLIECIFKTKTELKMFMEELDENFQIQEKHVFEMYNDLKREGFLDEG